jgi:phosphoribosylformylglycinamidine synthase
MSKPRVIVIRTAGTNCDYETAAAFELAGARADRVHVNRLISNEVKLSDYQILAVPGGFSYGDDIASGKILANEMKNKLGDPLRDFALKGKPVIGICNGFQVLVKMGILPDARSFSQTTTLTFNDSDKFECRWVYLKAQENGAGKRTSLWVRGLPHIIPLPVAHGEGKFVAADVRTLNAIERSGQVVFRYVDERGAAASYPANPNGAVNAIAGICNARGNVFGLMPHPERFVFRLQHPTRTAAGDNVHGWGLQIFKNAVAGA